MKRKEIGAGILVLVLVFGMMVMGCDEEPHDGEIKIINGTLFDITQVIFESDKGVVVKIDKTGIAPTKSKTYVFSSKFEGECIVTVAVDSESVTVYYDFIYTGPGYRDTASSYTLIGSSKETLTLTHNDNL